MQMNVEMIQPWLQERLLMLALMGAVALIDVILAVVVAVQNKEFKLEKLPEFLFTFVKWGLAWVAAELIQFLPTLFGVDANFWTEIFAQYTGGAVYAGVMVKYGASILGHIQDTQKLPDRASNVLTKIGIPPDAQG